MWKDMWLAVALKEKHTLGWGNNNIYNWQKTFQELSDKGEATSDAALDAIYDCVDAKNDFTHLAFKYNK